VLLEGPQISQGADRAADRRLRGPVEPPLQVAEPLRPVTVGAQDLGVQRVGEDREDPRTGAVDVGDFLQRDTPEYPN
jgi:hypothetical protein